MAQGFFNNMYPLRFFYCLVGSKLSFFTDHISSHILRCTVWLLRSYHLKIGGNCFDAMRQKIKNPAPLRTSLSSWLVRNGAGFLIFCLMASKQFPPFWPSLIVDFLYQFSTYRRYIILDCKYFFKSK